MKLSVIALALALPVIANAGTTCYKATSATYEGVPSVLCLEGIRETATENLLFVESADRSFPALLDVVSSSRHNEDRVNFTATTVLKDETDTICGHAFTATLKVKSEIAYGEISEKYLDITVETERTNDTCHSQPQYDVIKYEIVK